MFFFIWLIEFNPEGLNESGELYLLSLLQDIKDRYKHGIYWTKTEIKIKRYYRVKPDARIYEKVRRKEAIK